jgi:tetratricopeptide (TPR) repeat protein
MSVAQQVALSEYLEEIRTQIREHHAAEALAQCKHVLRQFPKHLETYGVMASALVESLDPNGALDLYGRVLSADPENIDAYVSTAQILEARAHLDEAVWHMERAFELAPTHADIRQELVRLYSQAEGKPHGRLKFTRGALGRLYVQEGLFPQAVREFREISQENPTRYDVRVALAAALWRAGQTRQAAEVAQSLLEPLPYCLKANLILGTAWRESALEESDGLLQRAQELDPTNQVASRLLGDRSPLAPTLITIARFDGKVPAPLSTKEEDILKTRERLAIEEANFDIPPLVATDETAPESAQGLAPTEEAPSPSAPEETFQVMEQQTRPLLEGLTENTRPGGTAAESSAATELELGSEEGLPDWLTEPTDKFVEDSGASKETGAASLGFNESSEETITFTPLPETESEPAESAQEIHEDVSRNNLEIHHDELSIEAKLAPSGDSASTETAPEAGKVPSEMTSLPAGESTLTHAETSPEEATEEGEVSTAPQEKEVPMWLRGTPDEARAEEKGVEEEEMPPWLDGAKAEAAKPNPTAETKVPKWVEVLSQPRRDRDNALARTPREESATATAVAGGTPPHENELESKYYSRLKQARQNRDENRWADAFADYDFVINKAPNLVKEVITDLEALVESGNPPLEAQRVLGDAYSRAGRLNDALESYRLLYRHLSELD